MTERLTICTACRATSYGQSDVQDTEKWRRRRRDGRKVEREGAGGKEEEGGKDRGGVKRSGKEGVIWCSRHHRNDSLFGVRTEGTGRTVTLLEKTTMMGTWGGRNVGRRD